MQEVGSNLPMRVVESPALVWHFLPQRSRSNPAMQGTSQPALHLDPALHTLWATTSGTTTSFSRHTNHVQMQINENLSSYLCVRHTENALHTEFVLEAQAKYVPSDIVGRGCYAIAAQGQAAKAPLRPKAYINGNRSSFLIRWNCHGIRMHEISHLH
eukprot:COSAG02_NODE_10708_length_1877_cov_1.951631_3_plen_157_part_00